MVPIASVSLAGNCKLKVPAHVVSQGLVDIAIKFEVRVRVMGLWTQWSGTDRIDDMRKFTNMIRQRNGKDHNLYANNLTNLDLSTINFWTALRVSIAIGSHTGLQDCQMGHIVSI